MNIIKAVFIFLYCFVMLHGIANLYVIISVGVLGTLLVWSEHNHSHNVTDIDYFAYNSKLYNINPYFKTIFFTMALIICVVCKNIAVQFFTLIVMAFIVLILSGTNWHIYKKLIMLPLFFVMLSTFTMAVDFTGGVHISHNGQIQGLRLFLTAFSSISCLYALSLTTPISDIIEVLRTFKIPDIIIELMFLVYRFVFVLSEIVLNMNNSAKTRGGFNGYKNSVRTYSLVVKNLLIYSLKKTNSFYDSMLARKYKGNIRFYCSYDKIKIKEILLGIVYFVIVGVLCFL